MIEEDEIPEEKLIDISKEWDYSDTESNTVITEIKNRGEASTNPRKKTRKS